MLSQESLQKGGRGRHRDRRGQGHVMMEAETGLTQLQAQRASSH